MLTVSTKAEKTALTTRAAVKAELGITITSEDDYIDAKILQVTDEICDYLGVKRAVDGTRTLGQETLVETFRVERNGRFIDHAYASDLYLGQSTSRQRRRSLILSRWPVASISSVVEGGTTLDATGYEVSAAGTLIRLSNGQQIGWAECTVVVTYVAGWLLPGQEGRNLPHSLEAAAIDYIKSLRFGRSRDPMVKSVGVAGIEDTTYWVGQVGEEGSIPPNVASRLDRYRRVSIG